MKLYVFDVRRLRPAGRRGSWCRHHHRVLCTRRHALWLGLAERPDCVVVVVRSPYRGHCWNDSEGGFAVRWSDVPVVLTRPSAGLTIVDSWTFSRRTLDIGARSFETQGDLPLRRQRQKGAEMTFKVRIDADKCIGSGVCALVAPEVFDLNDDGTVVLLQEDFEDGDRPKVDEAAAACPAWVIETVSD